MFKYHLVNDLSKGLWNSFLEEHSTGNFEQCFEYGEISKKAFPRSNVVRLACMDGSKVVGILQGGYSKYFGFGMTLGVMRGPVLDSKDGSSIRIAEDLLKALDNYVKEKRVIEARILVPETWQMADIFNLFGYSVTGRLNEYVVTLENGTDWLWKHISHNKRRNIKKAMKENVDVIESRRIEDLLTFYSMLEAAERRGGFLSYPLSWFKAVWNIYDPDLSKVFLAFWNGKAVSGVFTVLHSKTVFALAAGSFKEGWKVRPNDILHWKVMEWACENGYTRYHMGLVRDPPPTKGMKAWGVWRWKREWNGNLNRFQVFGKLFLPRYKLMLKAKKLAEKGYRLVKRLK